MYKTFVFWYFAFILAKRVVELYECIGVVEAVSRRMYMHTCATRCKNTMLIVRVIAETIDSK